MIRALRHRRKIIALVFSGLIAASVSVYLKLQSKFIANAVKGIIEDRIGEAFKADLEVESIRIGVVGPVVLNSPRLVKATAEDTAFIFKSEKLILYLDVPHIVYNLIFKKQDKSAKDFAFRIENGFLYKGEAAIFKNISGSGKIVNDNLVFNDVRGKVYDFPLSVHGKIQDLGQKSSMLDLNIQSASRELNGKIHLSKNIYKPHLVGKVEPNGGGKFYFSFDADIDPAGPVCRFENFMFQNKVFAKGEVNLLKKKAYAQLELKGLSGGYAGRIENPTGALPAVNDLGGIHMIVDFSAKDTISASALFNHVKIGDFDYQCQVDLELAIANFNNINGKIKTSGTVLDYKPFKELEGEFSIKNSILNILRLVWGEDYSLTGAVDMLRPYNVNLALNIKDGDVSQLFLICESEGETKNIVSGKVDGVVKVTGHLNKLITEAKLKASRGNLGGLDYESLNINLSGRGPVLKVVDSRILRKEGFITLSGEVDLKKVWSDDPAGGLIWKCGNEVVVWNGWDIVKQANSLELQMKKAVGSQKEFMVTFKGYLNDEQAWEDTFADRRNKESVGVEYNIDDARKVKMQLRNNEEIFSLENKVRF